MYFTGFADEAADGLADQIDATRALGWTAIEARKIDGVQIHDLDQAAFDRVADTLRDNGMRINCFGSAIANWGKFITDPDTASQAETTRAIARMQRLGTTLVRIMSYAVRKDEHGVPLADQMEAERFRRLRELTGRFRAAGLTPVHENCMNYGGMGWRYTQRLVAEVPGLQLVFDTGNPTHSDDVDAPFAANGKRPQQDSWEFYRNVRDHVAYIHIKDGKVGSDGTHVHTWPGEGAGCVVAVLRDLLSRGYDGGISIEPHMAVIHHDPALTSAVAIRRANYIEYGRRTMALVDSVRRELGHNGMLSRGA